jgi:hypothetical protein
MACCRALPPASPPLPSRLTFPLAVTSSAIETDSSSNAAGSVALRIVRALRRRRVRGILLDALRRGEMADRAWIEAAQKGLLGPRERLDRVIDDPIPAGLVAAEPDDRPRGGRARGRGPPLRRRRAAADPHGPGGVGKTRLAVEAGGAVHRDFADGARFISLAAVRAAADVPSAIVHALALAPLSGETDEQALTRFLAAKEAPQLPISRCATVTIETHGTSWSVPCPLCATSSIPSCG